MGSWRPLTWVILVVNGLFVLWVAVWFVGAVWDCVGLEGAELDACSTGTAIGLTIGIGFILFLWVMVDVILVVIWLVTSDRGRTCPACGSRVQRGMTACRRCGHDFAAAASGRLPHGAPPPTQISDLPPPGTSPPPPPPPPPPRPTPPASGSPH